MFYTDPQRKEIAEREYSNYQIGNKVYIDQNKLSIGYVSDVVNNKATGEQAYIITDGNHKTQKIKDVKNVTVLYQGSLGLNEISNIPKEVYKNWSGNLHVDNHIKLITIV